MVLVDSLGYRRLGHLLGDDLGASPSNLPDDLVLVGLGQVLRSVGPGLAGESLLELSNGGAVFSALASSFTASATLSASPWLPIQSAASRANRGKGKPATRLVCGSREPITFGAESAVALAWLVRLTYSAWASDHSARGTSARIQVVFHQVWRRWSSATSAAFSAATSSLRAVVNRPLPCCHTDRSCDRLEESSSNQCTPARSIRASSRLTKFFRSTGASGSCSFV